MEDMCEIGTVFCKRKKDTLYVVIGYMKTSYKVLVVKADGYIDGISIVKKDILEKSNEIGYTESIAKMIKMAKDFKDYCYKKRIDLEKRRKIWDKIDRKLEANKRKTNDRKS